MTEPQAKIVPDVEKKELEQDNLEQNRWLRWIEFSLALFLGLAVLFVIIHLGFWIFFGFGGFVHERVISIVHGINNNWKVSIVVLIPLFYRPIRKFLVNLRKGPLGMESGIQTTPAEQKKNYEIQG